MATYINTMLPQRAPKQNDYLALPQQQSCQNFINEMLRMQMERTKGCYISEEEHFVLKMLHLNPVTVEQRVSQRYGSSFNEQAAKRQAEACRKSRLKNKIKKAKARYRYNYVVQKLSHNINVYQNIRTTIAQIETQLLLSGSYTKSTLLSLRNTVGFRY